MNGRDEYELSAEHEKALLDYLEFHKLRKSDLRVGLLFGSRAKGYAREDSDIDLILIPNESPSISPMSLYDSINVVGVDFDINVVDFSSLDAKCHDPANQWAYRLHLAKPLRRFCSDKAASVDKWIETTNKIIDNPISCAHRARSHIKSIKKILKLSAKASHKPYLLSWFASELFLLIDYTVVNLMNEVPFATSYPDKQVAILCDNTSGRMPDFYHRFARKIVIEKNGLECRFEDYPSYSFLRSRYHRLIENIWPETKGHGHTTIYQKSWTELASAERELQAINAPKLRLDNEILSEISEFAHKIAKEELDRKQRQIAVRKLSSERYGRQRHNTLRHLSYDPDRKRLKAIIPTGGCKVGSCYFCMLTGLGKGKGDVDDTLEALESAIQGELSELVVYTDGSFFDNRELSDVERNMIAEYAAKKGAKSLLVESLPQFVSRRKIARIQRALEGKCRLRIGIGVQSMNQRVRKLILNSPVNNGEINRVLRMRDEGMEFDLRMYLMAGKPLMSVFEDVEDLHYSLKKLNAVLRWGDVVTINTLVWSVGTVTELVGRKGYYSQVDPRVIARLLARELEAKWSFLLEYNDRLYMSCVDNEDPRIIEQIEKMELSRKERAGQSSYSLGPAVIPWGLLGDLASRHDWLGRLSHTSGG